jgi:regulator of RNase E activity RraA
VTERLSPDELAELCTFTTPTVCNAIETFGVRPRTDGFMDSSIVCRFPELPPMVGYAVTARIRAADPPGREVPHRELWQTFEAVPKPWVVVIEDLDLHPVGAFWGEVNASSYRALGAIGVVTNGGVRDLAEVRPLGFHFFSTHILVSHAYVHAVEAGGEVRVGGLAVRPGDLLHGDRHGVTSIPHDIARRVADASRQVERAERVLIDYARSPDVDLARLAELYGNVD